MPKSLGTTALAISDCNTYRLPSVNIISLTMTGFHFSFIECSAFIAEHSIMVGYYKKNFTAIYENGTFLHFSLFVIVWQV